MYQIIGCIGLLEGRLRDLGYLAAHFDAPLVSWLNRERTRAARVEDFVGAIRRLHADFSWPFPSLPNGYPQPRSSGHRRSSSSGLDEKLQALEVDVTQGAPYVPTRSHLQPEIGDSGYLSNSGNGDTGQVERSAVFNQQGNGAKSHAGGGLLLQTVEAQLQPHLSPRQLHYHHFYYFIDSTEAFERILPHCRRWMADVDTLLECGEGKGDFIGFIRILSHTHYEH